MTHAYPRLSPFGPVHLPAPTGAESAEWDRIAIEDFGVPQVVLMENAGRGTAEVVQRLFPTGPVLALVGSGNNGGDALVCIRTLVAWGREVRAILVSDRTHEDPLLHGWAVETVTDRDLSDDEWTRLFQEADVVIDGVFGTGVRDRPRDRQADAILRANRAECPILSIDVPSGVDANTGAVPGEAIEASVTVTYGAPKLGSLLHPARRNVGRLVAIDIGFPPTETSMSHMFSGQIVTPAWAYAHRPLRSTDTHKNAVGRVLVIAGQAGMAGAALLAARAAYHAGAGFVRVCSPEENRAVIQSSLPEAVFVAAEDVEGLREGLEQADAALIGPGMGTEAPGRAILDVVAEGPSVPLVVDADGLNLAAEGAIDLAALAKDRLILATPHVREMARLLHTEHDVVIEDRLAALREAADRFGHAVLLKGSPSLVTGVGRPILVDTQATSDLAVAGMGDALAGVCTSLMAQGVSDVHAGALGLFFSGRAARIAGRGVSLTPSDVVRWLPSAMNEHGAAESDLALGGLLFDAEAAR